MALHNVPGCCKKHQGLGLRRTRTADSSGAITWRRNKSLKPTLVRPACSGEWERLTEPLQGFGRQGGLTLCYAALVATCDLISLYCIM
jgi:hypothetical protein